MREDLEKLPEPFHTGVKKSDIWKEEEADNGLPITSALTILLSMGIRRDGFFVARLGYDEIWQMSVDLGMGEEAPHP